MSDQQKNVQDHPRPPWEGMPFAGMMRKMMGQQGEGCGCSDMMSQMMAMCREAQEQGSAEEVVEKATQEA